MNRLIAKVSRFIEKRSNFRIIFVIGTGRSGTHWIGYTLQRHPNIYVSIEKSYIFYRVTSIALDSTKKNTLFPILTLAYRFENALAAPLLYADKSHPNIWLAEDLARVFPKAQFIGIQRGPYATVASMLNHGGVLSWFKIWKKFPVPNPFLGITESTLSEYEKIPLAGKCALRWRSHFEHMNYLQAVLGSKLHIIQYEDFINETEKEVKRLSDFLSLDILIPIPEIKRESLDRWRTELSDQTYAEIHKIVGDIHSDTLKSPNMPTSEDSVIRMKKL